MASNIPSFDEFKKQNPNIPTFEEFKKGQEEPEQPEEKSLSGFFGNLLSSGYEFGKNIAGAVVRQTPEQVEFKNPITRMGELGDTGQAIVQSLSDRYGSWDKFSDTLYKDPVGVLSDLSMLAGGTGLALKGAGMASKASGLTKTAQAIGKATQVASAVSSATDPLNLIASGTRAAVANRAGQQTAERLYESALKPSLAEKNLPKIKGEVKTGLTEKIPVSESGAEKLGNLIDDLNDQISTRIAQSKAKINPVKVSGRTRQLERELYQQVNPQADLATVETVKQNYLTKHSGPVPGQPGVTAPQVYPIAEAQAEKVGTYKQLRKKYGQLGSAEIETEKALARGIKEEIASKIPELKDLNLRESQLIGLDTQMEKAVARIRNHQIFGIGTPIAAGGVHAMTGSNKVAAVAGIIRGTIDNPAIKSKLAIAIYNVQKRNPAKYGRPNLATIASRLNTYINALKQPETEDETEQTQ